MDLTAVIAELRSERERIETALASLEAMQISPRGRGRKFMGAAERQQVSERMKRYWESRRKARRPIDSTQPPT